MAADEVYRQCRLRQVDGAREDVAWIPEEWARVGRKIIIAGPLSDSESIRWQVCEVWGRKTLPEIREQESTRRRLEDKLDG